MTDDDKTMIRDLEKQISRLSRGPRSSPATVSQQRDMLKRLIELAGSPQSTVKTFVAKNIQLYIKDFPELEDDAINAVYDLCEDQDPQVRMDGYRAITQVSRQEKKWVKRNADVLVQLLQSDEPAEVAIVERQLLEHLDLDPTVAVNVLCDQVVPTEEAIDEEEQTVRDRLRALVLDFMKGGAKRGIVRNATAQNSEPEKALVNRVLNAFSRFTPADLDTLVKDILLSLPSYTSGSERSVELLKTILAEAEACYKTELGQESENAILTRTHHLLELASFVAVEKSLANPAPIVHFWRPNKVTKIALQRFSEEFQIFVFDSLVSAYSAMQLNAEHRNSQDMPAVRTSVVDASVLLLPCFANARTLSQKPWESCRALLEACESHKSTGSWAVPSNLVPTLREVQKQAADELGKVEDKKCLQDILTLTSSLLKSASPRPTTPVLSSKEGMSSEGRKSNGRPIQIKRRHNEATEETLPARPRSVAANQVTPSGSNRNLEDTSNPRGLRQGQPRQDPTNLNRARYRDGQTPGPSSQGTPAPDAEPLFKRKKLGPEASVPTLLSRLALANDSKHSGSQPSSASIPAKRPAEADAPAAKRPHIQAQTSKSAISAKAAPAGGFSIKGAALRKSPEREQPHSLLNRLANDGGGGRLNSRRRKT